MDGGPHLDVVLPHYYSFSTLLPTGCRNATGGLMPHRQLSRITCTQSPIRNGGRGQHSGVRALIPFVVELQSSTDEAVLGVLEGRGEG